MTVAVERQALHDPGVADRVAGIYEASFPPSERGDTAELVASIAAGERLCYVARDDGAVIGFAVVFGLDGLGVALLEYLAVDPEQRNAGVGGAILTHLRSHLEADGGVAGILLEVEPPAEAEGDERTLRERRIGFYLRHGATVVDCAPRYRTPSLEREDETVSYTLLWVPLAANAPTELNGRRLRRCIEAILTESYELPRDDPLVREVIDELAC
jgi:ribosomal protein S18 acetylase RimI-like enzyme